MKKIAFLLMMFLFVITLKAQSRSEWKYERNVNGVSFYTKYLCQDNCSYELFLLKAVNETGTKKNISTGDIKFYYNSADLGKKNGEGFFLKPFETTVGEKDGLLWNVPKGWENKAIGYLLDITVKDAK